MKGPDSSTENVSRFLTAEWSRLILANYEVDPAILGPWVPQGVELHPFEGRYYMSLVGFLFSKTRLWGLSVPFHQHFEEVNLRFYVRRQEGDGTQRGVVFIREIVPRATVALVARIFYNEGYISLRMRHLFQDNGGLLKVRYEWQTSRWNRLEATVRGLPVPFQKDSLEEFLADHTWGFTTQRNGSCSAYRVAHRPWNLWRTQDYEISCPSADKLYGRDLSLYLSRKPASVLVADGSPVEVYRACRLS